MFFENRNAVIRNQEDYGCRSRHVGETVSALQFLAPTGFDRRVCVCTSSSRGCLKTITAVSAAAVYTFPRSTLLLFLKALVSSMQLWSCMCCMKCVDFCRCFALYHWSPPYTHTGASNAPISSNVHDSHACKERKSSTCWATSTQLVGVSL